jgi:DNA-binding transcriptional ArsR family regulator
VTGTRGRPRKAAAAEVDAFAAVADPTRRLLLERLACADLTVSELGIGLPLSQPALSAHLRVLREAGLVRATTEGRTRRYSIDTQAFAGLREWLDELDRFWRERLNALGAYLDGES